MLTSAIDNARISDNLVKNYSVDKLEIHKQTPEIYQMAVNALNVFKERICSMSFDVWDAAANLRFCVAWINSLVQKKESFPIKPEYEISILSALPPMLGL